MLGAKTGDLVTKLGDYIDIYGVYLGKNGPIEFINMGELFEQWDNPPFPLPRIGDFTNLAQNLLCDLAQWKQFCQSLSPRKHDLLHDKTFQGNDNFNDFSIRYGI